MSIRYVFSRIEILTWFISLTLLLQISGSQCVVKKYDCVPTDNAYQISLFYDLCRPVISPLHCAYFCHKESNCVGHHWMTANSFCRLYKFDSESTTNLNLTTRNFCRNPSLAVMVLTPTNTTVVLNFTTTITAAVVTTNLVIASVNETTSLVTETNAPTDIATNTITNTTTNTTLNIVNTSGSTTTAACTPPTPLLLKSTCINITCICDKTLGGLYTVVPSLSDTKCWLTCAVWAELGNNCTSFAFDPHASPINNCKLTATGTDISYKLNNVVCYCKHL